MSQMLVHHCCDIDEAYGEVAMTQYLGEEGKNCPLTAAVLVSNPWNLEIASHALQRSWIGSEIYAKTLGRNMRNIVER
jgi:predicted alpha/beta-fold hydrolase